MLSEEQDKIENTIVLLKRMRPDYIIEITKLNKSIIQNKNTQIKNSETVEACVPHNIFKAVSPITCVLSSNERRK